MKKLSLVLAILCIYGRLMSQSASDILAEIKKYDQEVLNNNCGDGRPMIITQRALNKLLADKVGSYLSESGDLSLFKNYATVSSSDGKFSLNRNVLKQPKGNNRIKHLLSIGFEASAEDGFASIFGSDGVSNDMSIKVRYTHLNRGSIGFDQCKQEQRNFAGGFIGDQKQRMNVERAIIIANLEAEMSKKVKDFEAALKTAPANSVGQVATVKEKFYDDLESEYYKKFAEQQVDAIKEAEGYNSLRVFWWSLIATIPVTKSEYNVAPTITSDFTTANFYSWSFSATFNGLFEYRKVGTFFLNGSLGMAHNNNIKAEEVKSTSYETYKLLGGTDTVRYASLKSDKAYITNYDAYWTPSVKVQVVYFPPSIPYGFSAQAEKMFGKYDPLNLEFGIPIRLNDKDGDPTVNFKLQYKVADVTGRIIKDKSWGEKSTLGLSVGLPFSSIIY